MTKGQLIALGGVAAFLWWWFNPPPGTVTTSEDFSFPGDTNYPESIKRFARAVAYAEGYGIPGAIPTVANNPGDLVLPGWSPTMGSAGIAVFDSADYGWNRLYRQLGLIVAGNSQVYALDDTIASMGLKWAGGDSNWSKNVAAHLNVPASTPLWQVLA
jgi:hypothetical protein